jgi:hypothetical protein
LTVHQSLLSHRKTLRASAQLHIPRPHLIGLLVQLWSWSLDNAKPDGDLGDVLDVEIAEAAGWPIDDAESFAAALVNVRLLDKTSCGYSVHNWPKYTGRYYEMLARGDDAGAAGLRGNHERWHVKRNIIDPECALCRGDDGGDARPDDGGDASGRIGAIIRPDSNGAERSGATSSDRNDQSEADRSEARDATNGATPRRAAAAAHPLNFSEAQWEALHTEFPDENVKGNWISWVEYVEGRGGRKTVRKPFEAFRGWMRKQVSDRVAGVA